MMLSLPAAAVGAIGASIVAAMVSLVGLTVSKEQKVSELRQAWIDALRDDLAELVAHAHAIHGASSAEYKTRLELWVGVKENFSGINRVSASVQLRLNPTESAAQTILSCMKELEVLLSSDQRIDFKALADIERRLVAEAQSFLKAEWERVKRGEPAYRWAKSTSWVGLILLVITLLYAGWTIQPESTSAAQAVSHPK
jgi:hypothetical protein